MYIRRTRGWELPESQATPEHVFLSRRALIGAGAGLIGAGAFWLAWNNRKAAA
jgi:sulfoxide reductase catalytic subunit YedY